MTRFLQVSEKMNDKQLVFELNKYKNVKLISFDDIDSTFDDFDSEDERTVMELCYFLRRSIMPVNLISMLPVYLSQRRSL